MPTEVGVTEQQNYNDSYPEYSLYSDWEEYVDDTDGRICYYENLPFVNIAISVLYYLIFIVGSLGNIFVILVMIFKESRRRRLVDTFVINLAFADLVFVFTLPFWAASASNNHQWNFGSAFCKISSYMVAVNRYSSIFFLTSMSIDRYLAIVKLLNFKHIRTQKYALKISFVIWISSLLLAIPSAYFRKPDQLNMTYCKEDTDSPFLRAFNLSAINLTFVLPVVIILFCYCSILVKLGEHYGHSKKTIQRRENSLKIVFTIVTAFILSWLPFNVFKTITLYLQFQNAELSCWPVVSRGLAIASCFAFVNSCVNPIIYAFLDRNFRQRTRRMTSYVFTGLGKRSGSFGSGSTTTESSTALKIQQLVQAAHGDPSQTVQHC
ncbi:probable G-protein coupled receptor 25 [Carcharodon carcharias]|uniref:probable G-protein coupled receptor 25 n=1 Tax=Carcharodon carcharias TaxID=13397 RepID=UPI001B7E5F6F|nr:probable G-protein coupled receptor 25 [Carcharodon carcharias]